jgi:hypothetical protein
VSGLKKHRLLLVVYLLLLSANLVQSQSLNYREIFGKDWDKAELFVKENRNWMDPKLEQFRISYPVAVGVIFPELVRYSAIRDKIEITLLKALYINMGEEYANFSVGPFQMKPSFGEMIRGKVTELSDGKLDEFFKKKNEYDDIKMFRASIVSDLENPETQVYYLIAFIKICEKDFRLGAKDDYEFIRFLATAYNYGFWKTQAQIEKMTDKKYFTTKLFPSETYSYSDVSLFWYRFYINNEKK